MSTTARFLIDDRDLAQIEALAHTALDVGNGLAGEAVARRDGEVYTVTVTLDPSHAGRADYWLCQVRDELRIAARCGLLRDAQVRVFTRD